MFVDLIVEPFKAMEAYKRVDDIAATPLFTTLCERHIVLKQTTVLRASVRCGLGASNNCNKNVVVLFERVLW